MVWGNETSEHIIQNKPRGDNFFWIGNKKFY